MVHDAHADWVYVPVVGQFPGARQTGKLDYFLWAGTDFIVVRDGRIAALYLFFDKQERDFALAGDSASVMHASRS
jgi:hypothetical protein